MKVIKDYYSILGVSSEASAKEISEAFRRLAKIYHPDKNHGSKVYEDKFKDINEAKDVLLDPVKRKAYDDIFLNFLDEEKFSKQEDFYTEETSKYSYQYTASCDNERRTYQDDRNYSTRDSSGLWDFLVYRSWVFVVIFAVKFCSSNHSNQHTYTDNYQNTYYQDPIVDAPADAVSEPQVESSPVRENNNYYVNSYPNQYDNNRSVYVNPSKYDDNQIKDKYTLDSTTTIGVFTVNANDVNKIQPSPQNDYIERRDKFSLRQRLEADITMKYTKLLENKKHEYESGTIKTKEYMQYRQQIEAQRISELMGLDELVTRAYTNMTANIYKEKAEF